jgi:hypothetical protein
MSQAVFVAMALLSLPAFAADPPKRAVPDYDGRGDPPTTAGDVALWVPRVVLAPFYLTTEYVLREPLGAGISAAERAHLPQKLYDFFFFGPNHKAGFAPIAFVDFGFRPSAGLYLFWDDAFTPGNDYHLHASTGGSDWFAVVFSNRIRFRERGALTLRLTYLRRPDLAFFGIGPDAPQADRSRYRDARLEASVLETVPMWRTSRVDLEVGIRRVHLGAGHFGDDPSVETSVASGDFPVPYGLDRGYTAPRGHLLATLDSRRPRPAAGSGVRLELEGEVGTDLAHAGSSGWVRYGAAAGGFVDFNGRNRVLSLSVATLFADPLGREPIPFTELVELGGDRPMRGFYPGRLRDRSAAVATIHYRWPIWAWLDGSLQMSAGNVFGEHLSLFEASRTRLAAALGIESVARDGSFELLVGAGTETWERGHQLDSVRIQLGTNRGF